MPSQVQACLLKNEIVRFTGWVLSIISVVLCGAIKASSIF